MNLSTIERAFALARSGQVANLDLLKRRLKADGCRAVDALLAPRSLSGHLKAICEASFKPAAGPPIVAGPIAPVGADPI